MVENTDLYREHIVHYFDTQLGNDIINLSPENKIRLFQMLTDYADILETIFHPSIPILEHILNKRTASVDHNHECEIICQYEQWKNGVQTA